MHVDAAREAPTHPAWKKKTATTDALRQLGEFYQREGSRARLPQHLGDSLLAALDGARAALPEEVAEQSAIDRLLFGAI